MESTNWHQFGRARPLPPPSGRQCLRAPRGEGSASHQLRIRPGHKSWPTFASVELHELRHQLERKRRRRSLDPQPANEMSSAYQKFIASASPPPQAGRQVVGPSKTPPRRRTKQRDEPQMRAESPRGQTTMMRQHAFVPTCGSDAGHPRVASSTPLQPARQSSCHSSQPFEWRQPQAQASNRKLHFEQQVFSSPTRGELISRLSIKHRPSVYGSREQQANSPVARSTSQCPPPNKTQVTGCKMISPLLQTEDPLLLKWLREMRFETELECLTTLQARTLAIDEHSAGALSVRNSQVSIQEIRATSNFVLDFIDCLIEALPLDEVLTCGASHNSALVKFSAEFSELWTRIVQQTASQVSARDSNLTTYQQNNLTIINCTPRKAPMSAKSLRPLDQLAVQIRSLCFQYAKSLDAMQNCEAPLDNGELESALRRLKELYGKFAEISIRAECANIVRALNYDFSRCSFNRMSSTSSLLPVRPFESSNAKLPLKWALIALWQLTKDDRYICRVLTEKWQTADEASVKSPQSKVAKRLDYSTKYESDSEGFAVPQPPTANTVSSGGSSHSHDANSLRSDYEKLYEICQNHHYGNQKLENQENQQTRRSGALSCALKSKQSEQQSAKSVSTIELLIDVIISQPNKHERLDMMDFAHLQAQHDKLVDLDEWDQSVSAAIYTSNQYKVAALRILNHLCANEQAIKTILRCFSTPPPARGQPVPENKIIRSIFECYQTAQEHIYQNDTMFQPAGAQQRKRSRQQVTTSGSIHSSDGGSPVEDEYSDYGSRQTNSIPSGSGGSHDHNSPQDERDDGDDVVVKEAIRLLIQLTTVFHKSNQGHDFYTLIGRFSIDSLVKYLTNILKSTNSREMVFLALTALANISFITTEPMKSFGTNRIMLEMFGGSRSRCKDLELRDQAVTILANAADKNLLDIVNNGGLTFLLSCLESCPTKMANYKHLQYKQMSRVESLLMDSNRIENKPRNRRPIDLSNEQYPDFLDCACDQQQPTASQQTIGMIFPSPSGGSGSRHQNFSMPSLCLSKLSRVELAALERIHQKAAVAFARMSVDPSTTRLVLEYGGVKQLIDMCKFANKRNFSDTVLIACIAALRKMAKVVDNTTFKHYNALDLIELDLNKALEIYGSPRDQTANDLLFASDV